MMTTTSSNPQLPRDLLITIEEGQNVQGEDNEAYTIEPSSYLSGIRNIVSAFLGPRTGLVQLPTGLAQPP